MRWTGLFVLMTATVHLHTFVSGQDAALQVSVEDPVATDAFLEPYREKAIDKWEKEIKKIEARDASEMDPPNAVLFIGSSSIRRWDDIAIDMSPFQTIQRGYGGSKYSDVAVFAPRLLHPHQYQALVIFVGNDVSGKPEDHTPDQVEELARYIVNVSQTHQPDAPVLLIEVTPTEKRFAAWEKIRRVNERLREIALSTPGVHFVATAEHYLDPQGNPRIELFVDDRLHLNAAGYDLWAALIRRRLAETLRAKAEFHARTSAAEADASKSKDNVSH